MTAYIMVSICLQVSLWVVDSVSVTLILLGANGFFIAPIFPSGIVLLVSRFPPQVQMGAVAIAIAAGQLGGAIAPLGVGFMATHLGIAYLLEVVCGLSTLMLLVWIAISRLG